MDQIVFSPNSQDLSALVASRLCHDLGNPLGAVSNGVELLQMSGMANSPEMALIADALRDTEARLRFFRIAYGVARPDQHISEREARNILSQMYSAGRLTVDWLLTGDLPRHHVKSAFLMIACAEAALPRGGISQSHSPSAAQLQSAQTGHGSCTTCQVWHGSAGPVTAPQARARCNS